MNGKIYDEIRKQYEEAKTPKERQKCIWTMLCMIGTNHLPHIENRVNKRTTIIFGFLIAILLLMVAQNPGAIQYIIRLIGGLF